MVKHKIAGSIAIIASMSGSIANKGKSCTAALSTHADLNALQASHVWRTTRARQLFCRCAGALQQNGDSTVSVSTWVSYSTSPVLLLTNLVS